MYQMSAVRLPPLDSPSKANINGGGATTRKSFTETLSSGGQPLAPTAETDEADGKKKDIRMRVGYYQMDKKHHVRYVFIPKAMLRNPQFDFDQVFAALQITVPDLVFDLNSAPDVDEWNLRLPDEYKHLQTKEMYNPEDKALGISRMLLHYQGESLMNDDDTILRPTLSHPLNPSSHILSTHPLTSFQPTLSHPLNPPSLYLHYTLHSPPGVVRENCKRLLRASTAACSQAGAVFRTKATWDMNKVKPPITLGLLFPIKTHLLNLLCSLRNPCIITNVL